jgi:ornithine carbamoyltransferase
VINALTDDFHPCQLLADIQTFVEHRGSMQGKVVAWVGDGNNMTNSYINAAAMMDFELRMAIPEGYEPNDELMKKHSDRVILTRSPKEAVAGAHMVVTDTWASMGQETERQQRLKAFAGYQVDHDLLSLAAEDVLFMHCLPAYRGMEVTNEVMEDPTISVIWDEAENRLHAQKALMEFLLSA